MSTPPRLLLITDRHQLPPGRSLVATVAACAAAGARHILVRERDLPAASYAALADAIEQVLRPYPTTLLVRAADHLSPGRGVHLRATDPSPNSAVLHGRSAHNADEVRAAHGSGCDYVTLSPLACTASKPGYGPPLGRSGLARIMSAVPTGPATLALGGVTAADVPDLLRAGAFGVAVMGSVMRAPDPGSVVRQLLAALPHTEPDHSSPHHRKETAS